VSGGSIFSGFLAGRMLEHGWRSLAEIRDWEGEIEAPFLEFTGRDLRTWPVIAHLPWNWALPDPRCRHMAARYRDRLSSARLSDLPESPRFVFLATDLTFGASYVFERDRVGSYQAGYARPSEVRIGDAVAASASFPPVFGPMRPPVEPGEYRGGAYRDADRDELRAALRLTDGGVYDNMGLEPALRDHDVAIVSDCGAPFGFSASPLPLLRHLRYPSVIMNQVQSLRIRQLMPLISGRALPPSGGRRVLRSGAYLSLDSVVKKGPGYPPPLVASRIACIRTDLDRFTRPEQQVLINHGYTVAEWRLGRRLGPLTDTDRPVQIPYPDMMDPDATIAALRDSHRRISLRRMLGSA
jgi:NTE family protein